MNKVWNDTLSGDNNLLGYISTLFQCYRCWPFRLHIAFKIYFKYCTLIETFIPSLKWLTIWCFAILQEYSTWHPLTYDLQVRRAVWTTLCNFLTAPRTLTHNWGTYVYRPGRFKQHIHSQYKTDRYNTILAYPTHITLHQDTYKRIHTYSFYHT